MRLPYLNMQKQQAMLFRQVKRTIDRYQLLARGERLIVGVSGGVDSMVLLHVLNSCRDALALSLVVAHVNHGLRPGESEKELELVRREANRLNLPFEYGQFDVMEFAKQEGLSLQDAGRRIRFRFFMSLLAKYGAQKIALGQNADDQVETVLLRLIRGAGLKGLKGMLPVREEIVIRPLLETWRKEIESFAREEGIPYLFDSSNLKESYLRNRLRLKLVPLIEKEYQPNFREVILKTSSILREEDDYIEKGAEEAYEKIVREEGDHLSFRFSEYRELHGAVKWRLLQRMVKRLHSTGMAGGEGSPGIDPIYVKLNQASPSFLLKLCPHLYLEKRYDEVLIRRGKATPVPPFEVELISPGRNRIEALGKEIRIEEIPFLSTLTGEGSPPSLFPLTGEGSIPSPSPIKGEGGGDTACFDFEELQFPLKIRSFRPGDRFRPLGMRGTQKVKAFFIDHKVPRFERERVPLLVSGERIIWVIGHRIDDGVKVTEKTRKVLKVQVRQIGD